MNILVTGGAGFIGTNLLIKLLENEDFKVTCVDSLSYASNSYYLNLLNEHPNRFSFLKVDINDSKKLNDAIQASKPDKIMHLAAESHVDNSISNPGLFLETNIFGTYNLLEAVRIYLEDYKSSNFLFHHISTDEVYGDLELNDAPFEEVNLYKPSSPYSASKASSDHLVKAWSRTYNIPSIITNCSNNYGQFQNKEKLIPSIILNLKNGNDVPIYGDGSNIRDWLYVRDHVEALEICMLSDSAGETYNIGGNQELTNIEIFNLICEEMAVLMNKDSEELKNQKLLCKIVLAMIRDTPLMQAKSTKILVGLQGLA